MCFPWLNVINNWTIIQSLKINFFNFSIFPLFRPDDSSQESVSWMSYFSQQASAYLPQQVNDLMLRGKSVAVAKLPILGHKTVVAMPKIQVF